MGRRRIYTPEEAKARRQASKLAYKQRDPKRHKAQQDAWMGRNRAQHRALCAKRWRTQPHVKTLARDNTLKATYGITLEDYTEMLAWQGGVCAICLLPETQRKGPDGGAKALAVDHCHTTGNIRSLLCGRCNTALGMFGESADRLRAAARYLDFHNPATPTV